MITNQQALERGTGRTTRLLQALPEDAVFFVHHSDLKRMVNDYCRHVLNRPDINVTTINRMHPICRGLSSIGIDHFVFESGALLDLDMQARESLRTVRNVYVLDEMNMPTRVPGSEIV
jgi:hypothetical protein